MIQAKVLKGFRDSLPWDEMSKKQVIHTLEQVYSLYGFVPIDTPALEFTEVLLGKGGGETDKQIFHFTDNGGRDVALRFDLTVPFARFVANHEHEIPFPFKRYHIAKVWRGENPQKGRYREFYQCDFDIVGVDSVHADFEILSIIHDALSALGIERFTIKVAHRALFTAYLAHLGCLEQSVEILRTVDKIHKIGTEQVKEQLANITGSKEHAQRILSYCLVDTQQGPYRVLDHLSHLVPEASEHADRLSRIFSLLEASHIADRFSIDPSITRGLDYYTGMVCETYLDDIPAIGSICSGGRYNDLASLYTKTRLPGVGASIGLDRLLAALQELNSPLATAPRSCDVLILNEDPSLFLHYTRYASVLRKKGVSCDVYLAEKKSAAQFKYAEQLHIPYAITIQAEDIEKETCTLRDLATRTNLDHITLEAAAAHIKGIDNCSP